MCSTKSCWFLPKDEFYLRILHCSVKLWTFYCHNYSSACYRKLKWNIARSLLVLPLLYLVSPDPTSVTFCGREASVEQEKKNENAGLFLWRLLLAQKTLKTSTSSAPEYKLH